MQLKTMGGVGLFAADGTPLLTGRRKELLLLAFLARRAPRGVPRAELAALLWDDRPADRARLSLRQALFRIRQLLPDGLVVTREEIGLSAGAVEVDVNRIERAAAAGAHETVADEWRGDFLPEADDAAGATWRLWLEGERAAHRRLFTRSLQALVVQASARAAWPEAIAHATAWCDAMPDDVHAHRRLTDILVLADRGAEAVARHASFMARQRFEGEPASAELDALEVRLDRSAGPTSSHPGAGSIFSPDMVGRGDEFAELSNAWRDARAGHPAVVVIEGDAGMGKTRLVSEFIRTIALGRGTSVRLHARAYGHDSAGDYGLARELLAPLASARGVAAAPPQELATLSLLLPSLRARFAELPEPSGDERALSMAVARVLTDVAEEQTVLLVVDDLAAADAASVRLLLSALRRLGESAGAAESAPRLLAILTVRTDTLSRAELRDAPSVRWLQLRPLDALQTESLIASMLELPPAERHMLATRLSAASGGRPLDIIEIVSELVEDGLLATDGGAGARAISAGVIADLALPHSAREALARRLARLDPTARELLGAIARMGAPFDPSSGVSLLGYSSAEVSAAIEQLLVRRLIRVAPGDGMRYEPAHRTIVELVLPPPTRAESATTSADAPSVPRRTTRWRREVGIAAFVAAASVIAVMVGVARQRARSASAHAPVPAIMIAAIGSDLRDSGSVWMADGVARLIEARLSQSESVEPIPHARVREAAIRTGIPLDSLPSTQLLVLARRLGADLLATGTIRRADTTLLFDLEVTTVATGALRRRVVVEGRDALALADAVAVHLWQSSGFEGERPRLAEVTTTSGEAYRQFMRSRSAQEGGRAGEQRAALDAAIALDSGFGSALIERTYLARSGGDTATERRLIGTFERHRGRIPLRDRLEWDAALANLQGTPARAESPLLTLIQRYPRDPRAYHTLAALRSMQGRWAAAESVTMRVLTLDSSTIELGTGACVSCLEYARLVEYRVMQGDSAGATAAARRLVELLPGSAGAWVQRAFVSASYGLSDDAVTSMRHALSLSGNDEWHQLLYGRVLVMARRFGEVDSLVSVWRRSGSSALGEQADDLAVVVALERGEVRGAVALMDATIAARPPADMFVLVRAHRMGRMGREREAARVLEEHVHRGRPMPVTLPAAARAFAWEHALLADAIALTGDTVRLRAIADSIQRIGARSYYGRDWRLHHHVRGLIAMRGARHNEAIREFEQARFGRPGWTRTLIELANAYLAVGRPHDAIRTLRAGYEGWPDAMARYSSRSELDRLLALSFTRAGQRDSAAVYSRRLPIAWTLGSTSAVDH